MGILLTFILYLLHFSGMLGLNMLHLGLELTLDPGFDRLQLGIEVGPALFHLFLAGFLELPFLLSQFLIEISLDLSA